MDKHLVGQRDSIRAALRLARIESLDTTLLELAYPASRHDVNRHDHAMASAAKKHAFDGADIAVIASPSERNVAGCGDDVVRRIEIDPAVAGAENAQPSVGGIGPDKPWLSGTRTGEQVAADVACRQPQRSQTGNLQVGKVLANTASLLEDFHRRRANARCRLVVLKFVKNTARQVRCRFYQGAVRRERRLGLCGQPIVATDAR